MSITTEAVQLLDQAPSGGCTDRHEQAWRLHDLREVKTVLSCHLRDRVPHTAVARPVQSQVHGRLVLHLAGGLGVDALVLAGVVLGERVLGELVARRIEQQALGFYLPVFLLGRARVAPPHVLRLYSLAIKVEREQRCTQLAARALDHETGRCMCAFDRREKVNEEHGAMLEGPGTSRRRGL